MRDGTVVTTRMHAFSSLIEASRTTGRVDPVTFTYGADLGRTGGDLRAFDGVVTLQQAGATTVRRYPATVHAHGVRREQISLPATLPGSTVWDRAHGGRGRRGQCQDARLMTRALHDDLFESLLG